MILDRISIIYSVHCMDGHAYMLHVDLWHLKQWTPDSEASHVLSNHIKGTCWKELFSLLLLVVNVGTSFSLVQLSPISYEFHMTSKYWLACRVHGGIYILYIYTKCDASLPSFRYIGVNCKNRCSAARFGVLSIRGCGFLTGALAKNVFFALVYPLPFQHFPNLHSEKVWMIFRQPYRAFGDMLVCLLLLDSCQNLC